MPSRPGEFHPEPLTDPDVILSHHPARATERRPPPSVEKRGLFLLPVGPLPTSVTCPFAPRALPRFLAITEQSAPARRIGTFGLAGSLLVPFPLASLDRFSSSVQSPNESHASYTPDTVWPVGRFPPHSSWSSGATRVLLPSNAFRFVPRGTLALISLIHT